MAEKQSKAEELVVVDTTVVSEPVVLEEKFVKVTINKTLGNQFIGAGWVELEKDKEVEVTQDQKRCLKEAGLIYI
jgi:hypothetical protein